MVRTRNLRIRKVETLVSRSQNLPTLEAALRDDLGQVESVEGKHKGKLVFHKHKERLIWSMLNV